MKRHRFQRCGDASDTDSLQLDHPENVGIPVTWFAGYEQMDVVRALDGYHTLLLSDASGDGLKPPVTGL